MDGRIKHRIETRIEAARLFDAGFGFSVIATHLRLPVSTSRNWQDVHRQGRLLDFVVMAENKHYSLETKLTAIEKFLNGTPKSQILFEFEISTRALFNKWVATYRKDGPEGLVAKTKGRKPSVVGSQSLEQKIYLLEMESALLKKYHALMAKEQLAQPSKRKQLPH